MRTLVSRFPLITLILLFVACTGQKPDSSNGQDHTASGKECRIGLVMPVTGGMATYGAEGVLAARIALEHARSQASASIPQLLEEDSASDPTQTNEAAATLLGGRNAVHTIVGEINSANTAAMVSQAREAQVPIIAPTASSISLTEMSNNLVRIWPSDSYEATSMLQYMKANGVDSVGVIYLQVPYGEELAEYFRAAAISSGVNVKVEGYPQATADFVPLLRRMGGFKNLYLVSYLEDAALILNQAHMMRARSTHSIQFFGTSVLDSPELVRKAGDAAEGIIFAVVQPGESGDPDLRKRFTSAYLEQRLVLPSSSPLSDAAEEPGFAGFHVYDAASIAFAACEATARSGSVSGQSILDYYQSMPPYKGITGQIEFDEKGDLVTTRAVVFKTVADGKIQTL